MAEVRLEVLGLGGPGEPPSVPAWAVERAEARGWKLAADWVPEMEDEETGETLGGFWSVLVYRRETVNDVPLVFHVDVGERFHGDESGFTALLDLAECGWEDLVATHTSRGASG